VHGSSILLLPGSPTVQNVQFSAAGELGRGAAARSNQRPSRRMGSGSKLLNERQLQRGTTGFFTVTGGASVTEVFPATHWITVVSRAFVADTDATTIVSMAI
jgi:hypothetical protein